LHLIDPEVVDLSNLQRYALPIQKDVGTPKIALAALNWVENVMLHPHQVRWAEFLRNRDQWNIPRVLVAVDSAEDRCAVQSALPRSIINAWTRAGNLGISRHSLLDDRACLMCL